MESWKAESFIFYDCAWCDDVATQNRMLQKVCDSCAQDYDDHDMKWGH